MMTFTMIETGRERGKCKHCGKVETRHTDVQTGPDTWAYACDPEAVQAHAKNIRRRTANRARYAAVKDAYDSVGMAPVRGNLGGLYFE
jgi:(p)ppGpp synthase/HD superfamily hydrolase